MKLEICKLCNKSKELQRSHVIGRSVFNNLLKNTEGNYGYITLLDEKKIETIKQLFDINSLSQPKPDDDINISLDQTQNLIDAIKGGLEYPELVNNRVQHEDLVNFLFKLKNIFTLILTVCDMNIKFSCRDSCKFYIFYLVSLSS